MAFDSMAIPSREEFPSEPVGVTSQDPRAAVFAELLPTCQRSVFLCAMSLLGNVADAEEVVQECGLLMWKKFHEFQQGTNFVGWACQIARYQALKLRAGRVRKPLLFSNEFLTMLAIPNNEESLARLETRRSAIAECIERLRAADRDLLVRRYRKGASTRDVAEQLHRSVQGTRRSLQRIRETLAKCVRKKLAREESE
jgi:RNA polymerase sigma-70 factor (ECF subfamily)